MAAALFAILISGVLLDANDKPLPKYPLVFFNSADGKPVKVTTNENGKFQVKLEPGTYRSEFGQFTVDKNTSTLKLKERPRGPLMIDVIRGDVILPKGPRG